MNKKGLSIKCFCNLNSNEFNKFTHKIFDYKKPPRGEINIDFKRKYYRKYLKCDLCGHFFGQHQLDLANLYKNDYINKAIAISKDKKKLSLIRNSLREKALSSPIFDMKSFGQDFSDLLNNIWKKNTLK